MEKEKLAGAVERVFQEKPYKVVISKPDSKDAVYRRVEIEQKGEVYQIAKYTQKQVFHENTSVENTVGLCVAFLEKQFRQANAFGPDGEQMILVSKKGKVAYKSNKKGEKKVSCGEAPAFTEHNRKKHYILEEGKPVAPLFDMGIFTAEGKVVHSMYDKFKQINRFVEMVDDTVKTLNPKNLHIIDFGCGKSYLTFILYYYFTEIQNIPVTMTGLDLKSDVIEKCNAAAVKYGYENLHFELGDVNGYETDRPVDMVVTLHACDTATDYALYHAIRWNARMIFSVPCCQHELNQQMESEKLSLFTRYGIVKERMAALTTDAIRGNLLEACGYKTQLLEFVDFAHTPKNILIRAQKKNIVPRAVREKAWREVLQVMEEFNLRPMLYELLKERF